MPGEIETKADWNTHLTGCQEYDSECAACCCPLPLCPVPELVCSSKTVRFDVEGEKSYDELAYDEAYAAWDAGGQIGPEPEKPFGYDDQFGVWSPMAEPVGAGTDLLPKLFRRLGDLQYEPADGAYRYEGTFSYLAVLDSLYFKDGTPGYYVVGASQAVYYSHTYTGWTKAGESVTHDDILLDGQYYDPSPYLPTPLDPPECNSSTDPIDALPPGEGYSSPPGFTGYVMDVPANYECTEARVTYNGDIELADYDTGGVSKPSCPGAWGDGVESLDEYASGEIRRKSQDQYREVRDGLTFSDFLAELETAMAEVSADGYSCEAVFTHDWPTIDAIRNSMPGDVWPECSISNLPIDLIDDPFDEIPPWAEARSVIYKWRIPQTWKGNWFSITWQVLTQIPGQADDLSEDMTWEWTGPGTVGIPSTWESSEYTLPAPFSVDPLLGVSGSSRRIVNIRYDCYRSPWGSKPEVMGEGYE